MKTHKVGKLERATARTAKRMNFFKVGVLAAGIAIGAAGCGDGGVAVREKKPGVECSSIDGGLCGDGSVAVREEKPALRYSSSCEIPSNAVRYSYYDLLYIGGTLDLGDGNKLVLNDVVADGPENTYAVISFIDADGAVLGQGRFPPSDCIVTVSVAGTEYQIVVKAVRSNYTLDGKPINAIIGLVSGVDNCYLDGEYRTAEFTRPYYDDDGNAQKVTDTFEFVGQSGDAECAEELLISETSNFRNPIELGAYSDRREVRFLGKLYILSKASENRVELLQESVYSPQLKIGESLDLGDGNRLVVDDLIPANESEPDAAVLSIIDSEGAEIANAVVDVEQGVVTIRNYRVRVYDVASDHTLDEKWASVAVVSRVMHIEDGVRTEDNYVSRGWIIERSDTVFASDGFLEGWGIELQHKWLR